MTHKQVYEKYKEMIPFYETKTDLYSPITAIKVGYSKPLTIL